MENNEFVKLNKTDFAGYFLQKNEYLWHVLLQKYYL